MDSPAAKQPRFLNIIARGSLVIKYANLTGAAIGPDGDDKLLPRPIPEGGGLEEFNPDEGSTDGTEP